MKGVTFMQTSRVTKLIALSFGYMVMLAVGASRRRTNRTMRAEESTMNPSDQKSPKNQTSINSSRNQTKQNQPIEKKQTRLILVRHGQTEWNTQHRMQGHADIPLNEQGKAQAKTMAEQLREKGHAIKGVYASDLQRAVHTAQEISLKAGCPVNTSPELRELHVGKAQGLTPEERDVLHGSWRKELDTLHPTPTVRWNHPEWPEGESKNEVLKRVTGCLENLAKKHPGEEVAVVTHAGVIYTLVESITSQMYDIPNCSATSILYDHSCSNQPFKFENIQHLDGDQGASQKAVQIQL